MRGSAGSESTSPRSTMDTELQSAVAASSLSGHSGCRRRRAFLFTNGSIRPAGSTDNPGRGRAIAASPENLFARHAAVGLCHRPDGFDPLPIRFAGAVSAPRCQEVVHHGRDAARAAMAA